MPMARRLEDNLPLFFFAAACLLQEFLYLVLCIVCFHENWNVRHPSGDVAAEQPFAWNEFQCLLQYRLVDHECVAYQSAIIGTWESTDKICVKLLQCVRVQVSYSLGGNAPS